MASGSFKSSTTSNGKYMSIEWRSTANASTRTSTFTAKMVFHGSIQGNALEGSNFTVNGTRYSIEGWWDSYVSGNPLTFKEVTITVNHDSNGNASVPVSAYILYNSASWSDLSASGTAVLDNIGTAVKVPTAPTSCTASGKYEVGEKITVNWSGATGAISAYQIQYCQYDMKTGWGSWSNIVEGAVGTTAINNITSVGAFKTKIKYRIRAVNSSGNSAWSPESNIIEHYGIKLWNDNNFKWGNIKVWNGSAWVQGHLLAWSGSEWVTTK